MTSPGPRFDNSYAALPERFYARLSPEPVAAPATIRVNRALCEALGFDADFLESRDGAAVVAGNRMLDGATPIATVYAGHQFGSWNPRLGDGRAHLLGEVLDADGRRFDVQLKGSGRTPYSRGGDGRSPLGPVLREYVVSEAMAALGVPTTRALAAATTGEVVLRDTPLPGGVLVRVAASHIRIGTFEYFASRGDHDGLRLLVEHVLARHYPGASGEGEPALALLRGVAERQAQLVARWQLLGFVHGVMNTDNVLVSGQTIDYGPCAFMEAYDPATVFSSIDHGGRYAYGNQPRIMHWNLMCLAQALLPVLAADEARAAEAAQAVVDGFPAQFERAHRRGLRDKLGLATVEPEDEAFVQELFDLMRASGSDFTTTFRRVYDLAAAEAPGDAEGEPLGDAVPPLDGTLAPWLERLRARWAHDATSPGARCRAMARANPALIPRNHLVQAAIEDAEQRADFTRFHRLVDALAMPQRFEASRAELARPAAPEERVCRTFCGT